MKKYIYSLIALFMITLCSAQMFISQAEYFWDTDPGAGNGTAVLASDGNFNSAFEQLTRTGITLPSVGLHKLCIRVKDNTGVWGPVFINVIDVQQSNPTSILAITQAEYFWDNDPGAGNGNPVLATDGNFNSTYEQLTRTGIALPPIIGLHVFNIRIKDNSGVWGPVFRNVINIASLNNDTFAFSNVIIYPNPVKDVLNLSFETTISSASIYNVLGQEVLTKSINANEGKIDVSNLTSGTYFVKVISNDLTKTIKIIKR
jgi:hypothetical protein